MTDLSLQPHFSPLALANSPLPVADYFDQTTYASELARIFARSPRYIGHQLSVPNVGQYHTLPQEGEGRVLVHTPKGIELISNVCRHRQSIMLKGRGRMDPQRAATSFARCTAGPTTPAASNPLAADRRAAFPARPLPASAKLPLQNWNGLLFERRTAM